MKTIRNYVDDAIVYLNRGLAPWVVDTIGKQESLECSQAYSRHRSHTSTESTTKLKFSDPHETLKFIRCHWNNFFSKDNPAQLRTLIFEMCDVRNAVYHHEDISSHDAVRVSDLAVRILSLIHSPEKSRAEELRNTLVLKNANELKTKTQASPDCKGTLAHKFSSAISGIVESIEETLVESEKNHANELTAVSNRLETHARLSVDELNKNLKNYDQKLEGVKKSQLARENEIKILNARFQKNDKVIREFQIRIKREVECARSAATTNANRLNSELQKEKAILASKVNDSNTNVNRFALQLRKELQAEEAARKEFESSITATLKQEQSSIYSSLHEFRIESTGRHTELDQKLESHDAVLATLSSTFEERGTGLRELRNQNLELRSQVDQLKTSLSAIQVEFRESRFSYRVAKVVSAIKRCFTETITRLRSISTGTKKLNEKC